MTTTTPASGRRGDHDPDHGPDRDSGRDGAASPDEPTTGDRPERGGGRHGPVTSWAGLLGPVLAVAALVALVLSAFAWPLTQAGPRELPLAVAAPEPVAGQLQEGLAQRAGENAFDITPVADRAAAERLVLDREASGALVVSPGQQAEVIVASGGGPAVARALGDLAAAVPPEAGGPAQVADVAPLTEDDPTGAGLTAAALALIIGGMVAGVVLSRAVRGRALQATGLVLTAGLAGMTAAWLLHGWLGAVPGGYWPVAGVLSLGIAAIAAALVGLFRVLGIAGLVLGALTMVLLGNPLSGAAVPAEMLPAGWGALGQLLPPGATLTALRSVAWFDGAGAVQAWWVLAGWLGAGMLLWALPRRRGRVRGRRWR